MAKQIILPHGWHPRPYQSKLWNALEGGTKRCIEVAHRRWGKDDVALHWSAVSAMQRPATLWHMLPQIAMARKAIWTAVNPHTGKRRIDEAFPSSDTAPSRTKRKCLSASRTAAHGKSSAQTTTTPSSALHPLASASLNGAVPIPQAGPTSRRSWSRTTAGRFSSQHHSATITRRPCTTWPAMTLRGSPKSPRSQIRKRSRTKQSRRSAESIMRCLAKPQAMR